MSFFTTPILLNSFYQRGNVSGDSYFCLSYKTSETKIFHNRFSIKVIKRMEKVNTDSKVVTPSVGK